MKKLLEDQNVVQSTLKEFDAKINFNHDIKKPSFMVYLCFVILIPIWFYSMLFTWGKLNEYNNIYTKEKYPIELIVKEQISYYGKDYTQFKKESGINKILTGKELNQYWNECIGSCEVPASNRFKNISNKQLFVNWVCNERVKEENYSATKYAVWKTNIEGCSLSNLEEVKIKDKSEISSLKWGKQKEMIVSLIVFFISFLGILTNLKIILKNNT